jgi:hypothetical protein
MEFEQHNFESVLFCLVGIFGNITRRLADIAICPS